MRPPTQKTVSAAYARLVVSRQQLETKKHARFACLAKRSHRLGVHAVKRACPDMCKLLMARRIVQHARVADTSRAQVATNAAVVMLAHFRARRAAPAVRHANRNATPANCTLAVVYRQQELARRALRVSTREQLVHMVAQTAPAALSAEALA